MKGGIKKKKSQQSYDYKKSYTNVPLKLCFYARNCKVILFISRFILAPREDGAGRGSEDEFRLAIPRGCSARNARQTKTIIKIKRERGKEREGDH